MTTRILRLAVLVLALCAAAAPPAAHAAQPRTSVPDVEDEVMCVSCHVPLFIAESPQANREKAFIGQLVDQGLTKQQVKARLVAEYGEEVLAMPESHDGIGKAAYVVPIAVVLALLAAAAFLLPRWRRRAPAPATGLAAAGPSISDAELRRLDDDLQRFDR